MQTRLPRQLRHPAVPLLALLVTNVVFYVSFASAIV
jgi:hypothetical protein